MGLAPSVFLLLRHSQESPLPKRNTRPPLTPTQQYQVASVWRLTVHQANKYYRRFNGVFTFEQLHDACVDGAVHAAQVYQDDRGAKFSTLAVIAMKSSVSRLRQHSRTIKGRAERAVGSLDGTYADGDPVYDPDDYRERMPDDEVAAAELFDRAKKVLPERLFTVLCLRLVEDCQLDEIAERIGRSRERAAQLYSRAVKRLGRDPSLMLTVGKTPPPKPVSVPLQPSPVTPSPQLLPETVLPSPGLGISKAARVVGVSLDKLRKIIDREGIKTITLDGREYVARQDVPRCKDGLARMVEEKRAKLAEDERLIQEYEEERRARSEARQEARRLEEQRLDEQARRDKAMVAKRKEFKRVMAALKAGEVVDILEAARQLGTHHTHVTHLAKTGQIGSFKCRHQVFIPRQELDRFLRECWSGERAAELVEA